MGSFHRLLYVTLIGAFVATIAPNARADPPALRPPVTAPVVDPFREPNGPYGAGNRGIEYGTQPGQPVVAAAAGTVIFAGPVAGELHVTIDHGGGAKTSYSYLERVLVRVGQGVAQGDLIGASGDRLHFGLRIDDRYTDPAGWFGRRIVEVRLVPHEAVSDSVYQAEVERLERQEFRELAAEDQSALDWLLSNLRNAQDFSDLWVTVALENSPVSVLLELIEAVEAASTDQGPCTQANLPPGTALPPPPEERRIAVVIDGLNSSSSNPGRLADLNLTSHGYDDVDIVRLSYNGGATPSSVGASVWAQGLLVSEYESESTTQPIAVSIGHLVALLSAVADANPGVPIDVFGHSLGGLVARHAIVEAIGGGGVPVGVAVTIASPHQGVPGATALSGIDLLVPGDVAAPVYHDLSEAGFAGDTRDVGFPPGVHAVAIGARTDLIVPASLTSAPGATGFVVNTSAGLSAHSDVVGSGAVWREIALALAGLPVSCQSGLDRLADQLVGRFIENTEQTATGLVIGAGP